jgi:hypothetical protein
MGRLLLPVVLLAGLAAAGCVPKALEEFIGENPKTTLVPSPSLDGKNPPADQPPTRVSYAPAAAAVGLRVDSLGEKIVKANPQLGSKPSFRTIGVPRPELFHRGVTELYITEGLVKLCPTDAQLAAVLCHELGKMVAEREALAGPDIRNPDRRAPMEFRGGNAGQFDGADQVRAAELAKFGPSRPRAARPLPLPDPKALARLYLKNAGFAERDLDAVAPQLQAADGNFALEKQLKAKTAVASWSRAK